MGVVQARPWDAEPEASGELRGSEAFSGRYRPLGKGAEQARGTASSDAGSDFMAKLMNWAASPSSMEGSLQVGSLASSRALSLRKVVGDMGYSSPPSAPWGTEEVVAEEEG